MKPHYFTSGGDSIFGVYHPAARTASDDVSSVSRMAAVICPAFGQEAIRSHRSVLLLAKRLAQQGVHVLRFAYRGTDDSSLSSDEIASLQDWRQDIVSAKEQLKQESGCESVMLIGLRLGANLVVDVASDSADVHSVVLWEPIENGRDYLESLRSQHREMIDLWHRKVDSQATEEIEELLGSLFQRCLLGEVERLRLDTDSLLQPALVVSAAKQTAASRGNTSSELVAVRDEMDKHIESVEVDGWQDLNLLEVMWWRPQAVNEIAAGAHDIFTRVEAYGWHRQYAQIMGNHSSKNLGDYSSTFRDASHIVEPAEVRGTAAVERDSTAAYRESVVQFGERASLTGILTEPENRIEGSPVVLMLNAGIVHRIGPFRLHVNIARMLAKHGFASLRIDLTGLGDSQPRTGKLSKDQRVGNDVAEAMEFLEVSGIANRFVLFGLCSGAYHAHHVAVIDPRIAGTIFLDGIVFRTLGYYLRHHLLRLFRPRFWRNAIKRRWLNARRKPQAGAQEAGNKLAEAEYFHVNRTRQTVAEELRLLQRRATNMLFIYTGDYDDVCGRSQFREMYGIAPSDQVQVDYVAHASHTLRIAQHRDQAIRRIVTWMLARF